MPVSFIGPIPDNLQTVKHLFATVAVFMNIQFKEPM